MRPWIRSIDQLGFVVRDLDACVRLFADQYGIGPWTIVNFGAPGGENTIPIEDVVLCGEAIGTYAIRCAVCDMPNGVQLELIEPRDGKSIFAKYLAEHGPGLQHVSVVLAQPFDDVLAHLRATGRLERGQIATVDRQETCVFADFRDTLGTCIELHKRPETFRFPDVQPEFYPASGKMPEDAEPLFTAVEQIGIVVPDLKAAVAPLHDEQGIGPWILVDFGDCGTGTSFVSVENAVLDGVPFGTYGTHIGICEQFNVQLEVMEPAQERGVLAVHLKKHGSDVHHLSLVHGDAECALARIHAAGFPKGQTCTIDTTETCIYADHTELLGIYLELHKRPEDFQPPQIELRSYPEGLDLRFGE